MDESVNILWVYLEDISPWFGCYGDALAQTPFIDSLAERGTLFERCYTTSPVCSPARSANITGTWPSRHNLQHHRTSRTQFDQNPLPQGIRTLPERFNLKGYSTFNYGKDDYNFQYDRETIYPGPYESHFHWKESRSQLCWSEVGKMRPFFGQIQLQGGKRSREEAITRLSPDIDSITVPKYYPDDPLFRKAIARHYGCIAYLDTEVGKIFKHLADEGLLENTVVFLFSDHGNDGLRAKQFCYEGGTHVPLIIVGPEKFGFRRGIRRNDLVSSLDISATTLALAGIKDNQVCDGQDLRDLSNQRSHVVSQRDRCDYTLDCIRSVVSDRFRYIENLCPDRPWLQAQYRSNWPEFKRWKELSRNDAEDSPALRFAREKRPKYELYDLKNDPDQVINLVDNPQYSDDLRRHREWLEKWCCAVNDPGAVFPESQLLSGLSRWGEEVCDHPLYKTVRERYDCSHGQHSELKS